ncbi:hypothetical protein B0T21DRAFT_437924 [Apiosordaria backusii]|uniref:Uncharacterized protein n=1 Tax=Apiosordaria backusii TaxID=314023 RepID=A0AA40BMJ8_9PEZI|nr:hypothetical protein B0T21DRAFT_437924 [Apiosordaria backusii]
MHHYRRKSGNTSMTDVRKAVSASDPNYKKHSSRPTTMTRRITPQSAPKLGRSPRDRERELDDERWWDEERESFPQYCEERGKEGSTTTLGTDLWGSARVAVPAYVLTFSWENAQLTESFSMVCEKQFVPSDDQNLYCSDSCRYDDQVSASAAPSRGSHPPTQYPFYSGVPEPRDIVPRASPSRPGSTHFSVPSSHSGHLPTAVMSLKSISMRPPSPSSPGSTYAGGVWPFTRSTATSPDNSYSKPTTSYFSSTYDGAYYGTDHYGSSIDRPLPSRRPGVYSRPKSIELVTPMLGR